ncbi:MAG: urease accessory protein UreE [Pseudomonadota bacterium]
MEVYERLPAGGGTADERVVLDHLQRERGRIKAQTESGRELRVFLERGKTLAVGELLRSECGQLIEVVAATEPVLQAEAADWQTFARACYHLGNRHVKVQIGECWLRITPDHVLSEMLAQLGLSTRELEAPFVPESGAYAGGAHGHHHH